MLEWGPIARPSLGFPCSCGGRRTKIVAPPLAPRSHRSLVVAVARGRCWARGLRRGDFKDTAQIASKFNLSESYVRRILRLAHLAPHLALAMALGRPSPNA